MSRRYQINYGRANVKPFKEADINNMMLICRTNRENATNEKERQLWDRNYMILHLGINLAFRIEDILQLRVNNIKNGYIYTREFKTGKEQSFELNPKLAKDIEAYIVRNKLIEGMYLFASRKGLNKPITRQQAWNVIESLAHKAGVNYPIGCHSLRKYFARQYYEKTGDIIGLKEMLNHSSERVTLIYICWNEEIKNERRKSFYLG